MKVQDALIQLRDDIKEWVTNNLNAIGKFSGKASDITLDPIDGSDSTNAQEEFERLNSNNMNEVTGVYNISSDIVVEASDSYTGFTVDNLLSYKYLFIRSNLGGEYVIPISFLKYRGHISLSFHRQQYDQYVASHFCDVRIDTNSNWIGIKHMGVYVKGWSNGDIIMEMNLYK